MSILGLCPDCGKLTPITPKSGKMNRLPDWYTVAHDDPQGKPCLGYKKAIV